MIILLIFTCSICPIIFAVQNDTKVNWVSSNFGSSFASHSLNFDINKDGKIDLVSVSVDGEVMAYDLDNGNPLSDDNWPVTIPNDHFLSAPNIYVHGDNQNIESLILVSATGNVILIDPEIGTIVHFNRLPSLFLNANWSRRRLEPLHEVVSQIRLNPDDIQLQPEVHADSLVLDLSQRGRLSDLLVSVNFVEVADKPTVVLAALAVFCLRQNSVQAIHPVSVSLKHSENPDYVLSRPDVVGAYPYELILTLSSGMIHQLQWQPDVASFSPRHIPAIVGNPGPHKCLLTRICPEAVAGIKMRLCCMYSDYYNHIFLYGLGEAPSTAWEYNLMGKDSTASPFHIALPAHPHPPQSLSSRSQEAVAVFGTDSGWIYCISMKTAKSIPNFPFTIASATFSTQPHVLLNLSNHRIIVILSDGGVLYAIPMNDPARFWVLLINKALSSFVSPQFLMAPRSSHGTTVLFFTKSALIWSYELPDLRLPESDATFFSDALFNDRWVGTSYSHGTTFSIDLTISDPHNRISQPSSNEYLVSVFINEYQYANHSCIDNVDKFHCRIPVSLTTGRQGLDSIYNSGGSLFLFGVVRLRIYHSSSGSQLIGTGYSYLRVNYDFQFELVWLIWLTFGVCLFAIALSLLHAERDKLLSLPLVMRRPR